MLNFSGRAHIVSCQKIFQLWDMESRPRRRVINIYAASDFVQLWGRETSPVF